MAGSSYGFIPESGETDVRSEDGAVLIKITPNLQVEDVAYRPELVR